MAAAFARPPPALYRCSAAAGGTYVNPSLAVKRSQTEGELAFAPRGVLHTYANLSGAPARALLAITPAGFERYFDRIAARITGSEPPPDAAKPIPEVVTVGPPLGGKQT